MSIGFALDTYELLMLPLESVICKLRQRVSIECREWGGESAIEVDTQGPIVAIEARREEGQYLPLRRQPGAGLYNEVAHPLRLNIHDQPVEPSYSLPGLLSNIEAVKTRAAALHMMGIDIAEP